MKEMRKKLQDPFSLYPTYVARCINHCINGHFEEAARLYRLVLKDAKSPDNLSAVTAAKKMRQVISDYCENDQELEPVPDYTPPPPDNAPGGPKMGQF